MLTKDTVKDHCSPQSYSILKYFLDPLSRLKKEEFREIVHTKHNIAAEELSQQNEEKVNRAIDEGYKKYLDMCELADEDGINFYITNNDTQSPFYNEHSEQAYIGQWHWHNKQVNCSINEIEGVIQILRNENLHGYDINIPSFGISSSPGDYYSQDMRDIVINNNSQLTGQISCSNSVTAKELINRNANINQYGLLYGNNPIILAISKGWYHIDPDSSRDPSHDKFPQMEIINKLMEYQDLDINVIDLKTGMTPLHIACLRGDSPELIIKLLEKGAKPEAEDYSGKKPANLLNYKYQEVQKVIGSMTGRIFGVAVGGTNYEENQSFCATLPTRRERDENVKRIREILHSNQSTLNKEIFYASQRELKNKINHYNARTLHDRGRESGYSSEEDSWNKMLTTLFKQKDQSSSNSNVPQGPEIEQPKLEPLAGQVHYAPDIEKSQKLIVEEAPSPTIGTPVKDSKPGTEHVKQNIEQPQLGLIAEEVNQAEVLQLEPEEPEAEEVPNPNIDVPTSEEDSKPEENLLQNADQDPGVAATSSTVGTSTTDSTSFNQQLPIKVPVPGIEQAQNPTLVVHTDDQDSNPQEGLLKDADQDPTVEVPSITVNIHEVDPQPAEPIMTKLPISGADLKSQINDIFPMSQKKYSFENYQSGKGLVELSKERVDIVNKYIESIKKDFIESQFFLKITYAQLCIKLELRCLSIDGNTLLLKEYLEIVKQYNGWVSSIFDQYEKWNDALRERNEQINRELARIEEILSSKTQKNEPATEVLQSEPEKSEAEEVPSPTVLTPEGDSQPETQLPNNVISPYATSKETEETDAEFKTYNGEKLKSEAPIYIPVAPSEDKNKNGVRENISYSQEKSKSNSKYYIVGCAIGGAIIGAVIAHCAGAAALTPVLAAVAVFIGAVVVGALLGAGIGYCISKCLDSPDVQSMSGQPEKSPEFFYT